MNSGDACPRCGQPIRLDIDDVPKPHYGRLVCQEGHWCGWVAAPMTYDRARTFVMPFGKYRGKTIADIAEEIDPSYLQWAARNIESKSIQRAIERFAQGPDSLFA